MSDDFRELARRIEGNPLGRLMYGQRELFHSNLVGWFFDMLPEAADATFRPLTLPGTDSGRWVDRERGHMDLVFHWPDRAPLLESCRPPTRSASRSPTLGVQRSS